MDTCLTISSSTPYKFLEPRLGIEEPIGSQIVISRRLLMPPIDGSYEGIQYMTRSNWEKYGLHCAMAATHISRHVEDDKEILNALALVDNTKLFPLSRDMTRIALDRVASLVGDENTRQAYEAHLKDRYLEYFSYSCALFPDMFQGMDIKERRDRRIEYWIHEDK